MPGERQQHPVLGTPEDPRPCGQGRILCADMEAVGLIQSIRKGRPEDLHVIVCKDAMTEEVFVFFDPFDARNPEARCELEEWEGEQDGTLWEGIQFLMEAEAHIFQNGTGFDYIAFEKVYGGEWSWDYRGQRDDEFYPFKVMDTYIMSCLLNPDRKPPGQAYQIGAGNVGPHSIEAHGIRIGRYKPENEDWSKLTDHMIHRCIEDVEIGLDFYRWLMRTKDDGWFVQLSRTHPVTGLGLKVAYAQERDFALSMGRQAARGFRIDTDEAIRLWNELVAEVDATEAAFRPHMPYRLKKKACKADFWNKQLKSMEQWIREGREQASADAIPTFRGLTAAEARAVMKDAEGMLEQTHCSYKTTTWAPWTKKGLYSANTQKVFPEAVGCVHDIPFEKQLVAGPYTPLEWEEIPLGNRDTVKQILYRYGWRGVEYNDTEQAYIDEFGELPNPWAGKINEKSLDRWEESDNPPPDWAKGIARWYILSSRMNQVLNRKDVDYYLERKEWPKQAGKGRICRGILAQAWCEEYRMTGADWFATFGEWPTKHDGEFRLAAEAIPIGTNTYRCRHRKVVNIPSRGLYPLRHLFIATDGFLVLGCDGAGLELRMLSHFMNDPEYERVILEGDIHSYNQEKAGLPDRDMAKTFIYAFLYGSGLAGLAATCGLSLVEMGRVVDNFKRELPALANLIEKVQKVGEEFGYLLAVDSRRGRIRKNQGRILVHTVLNVLLQMTGSLCMKYGLVTAVEWMEESGIALDELGHPRLLANVHDEAQMEVPEGEVLWMDYEVPAADWKQEEKRVHTDSQGIWSAPVIVSGNPKSDDPDEVLLLKRAFHPAGDTLCRAFAHAGKVLGIRCPLAGEYKVGKSWQETH